MDAKSVCKAAGIPVSALTVWQQRGLIPGYVPGGPGRRRHYSVDDAVAIGVMAALSRLGIGPTAASGVARQVQQRRYLLVIPELPLLLDSEFQKDVDPPPGVQTISWSELREMTRGMASTIPFDRLGQLDDFFAGSPWDRIGRGPDAFVVVDVSAIRDRMEKLEAQDGLDQEPDPKRKHRAD